MSDKDLEQIRESLEKQRAEINRRINQDQEVARETIGGVGDAAEISVLSHSIDTALSLSERWTIQFNEIERALGRLRRGDYGSCQECGEKIALKRLQAMPTATTCVQCASLAEQGRRHGELVATL